VHAGVWVHGRRMRWPHGYLNVSCRTHALPGSIPHAPHTRYTEIPRRTANRNIQAQTLRLPKDRKPILQAIQNSMESFGWPPRRVCGLAPCCAKDTVVTPYFFCSALSGRPFGSYRVEGSIGVIHQSFERIWAKKYPGYLSEYAFGVTINIANFSELSESGYIAYEGPFEAPAERFCAAVVNILDRLPLNEDQLYDAFQKDDLGGKRVDMYSGWAHIGKFREFKDFVKQHFQHHPETSIALRGIALHPVNFIVGIRSRISLRLFLSLFRLLNSRPFLSESATIRCTWFTTYCCEPLRASGRSCTFGSVL